MDALAALTSINSAQPLEERGFAPDSGTFYLVGVVMWHVFIGALADPYGKTTFFFWFAGTFEFDEPNANGVADPAL